MIKVHSSYRFEQYQWFNIPKDVRNQLTHMKIDYQANKHQRTNNYNRNTGYKGSNIGSGNQFVSYQAQTSQAHSVPYGGSVI